MAPHVKNEHAKLLRKSQQLLNELAKKDPDTVLAYRACLKALELYSAQKDERYAKIRSTKEAIRSALEFEGTFLPKRVLAKRLMDGGFQVDPEFGPNLLVASMDKNIQRGHFVKDADGQIGLPEWLDEKR